MCTSGLHKGLILAPGHTTLAPGLFDSELPSDTGLCLTLMGAVERAKSLTPRTKTVRIHLAESTDGVMLLRGPCTPGARREEDKPASSARVPY